MDEIEDRRGRAAHVDVRVILPVPDRLDAEKRPFNAVDQHLPIVAVTGRQRRRIDCSERIERRVEPRGVFSLAVPVQIIDLGILIMHANACRGDRLSSKLVVVKGLDEILKRLRLGRAAQKIASNVAFWKGVLIEI
jgi:hypothetical protein